MFESNIKQACRALVDMETKERLFTLIAKAKMLPKESDKLYRIPFDLDFVENAIFTALQRLVSKVKELNEKINRVKKTRVAQLARIKRQ